MPGWQSMIMCKVSLCIIMDYPIMNMNFLIILSINNSDAPLYWKSSANNIAFKWNRLICWKSLSSRWMYNIQCKMPSLSNNNDDRCCMRIMLRIFCNKFHYIISRILKSMMHVKCSLLVIMYNMMAYTYPMSSSGCVPSHINIKLSTRYFDNKSNRCIWLNMVSICRTADVNLQRLSRWSTISSTAVSSIMSSSIPMIAMLTLLTPSKKSAPIRSAALQISAAKKSQYSPYQLNQKCDSYNCASSLENNMQNSGRGFIGKNSYNITLRPLNP